MLQKFILYIVQDLRTGLSICPKYREILSENKLPDRVKERRKTY